MIFPWPAPVLNPNSIASWHKKAKAKKKYRADCYQLTKASGRKEFPAGYINLKISFYPPDGRRRDLDNCLSSIKAGIDGMAEAWGIDDSRFFYQIVKGEITKQGAVKVEIV